MRELVLAGPGKNALGTEMLTTIADALRSAAGAPLLLRGEGGALSAGLHLREVASLAGADAMRAFLVHLDDVCAELFDYPGPIVALVDGHAIAGGCVLAQCCDYRVAAASPRLRIGLNETALGVAFPPRILGILKARIPLAHQHDVLLGAGIFSPEDALARGLVDVVAEDAEGVARAWLTRAAAHSPGAYAATKADLRRGATTVDAAAHERFYGDLVPRLWASAAVRERLLAVIGG